MSSEVGSAAAKASAKAAAAAGKSAGKAVTSGAQSAGRAGSQAAKTGAKSAGRAGAKAAQGGAQAGTSATGKALGPGKKPEISGAKSRASDGQRAKLQGGKKRDGQRPGQRKAPQSNGGAAAHDPEDAEGEDQQEGQEEQPQAPGAIKSAFKDVKKDRNKVLRAAASGAVTGAMKGGQVGAIEGAAVAAVKQVYKSKTYWRIVGVGVICMVMTASIIAGVISGSSNSMGQAMSSGAYNATEASLGDDDVWRSIEAGSTMSGSDPTVLSAIYKIQQEKGLASGVGPMGIDMKAAKKIVPSLSEDEANETEAASLWVGGQLQESISRAAAKAENLPIDAGYSPIMTVDEKDQRIELPGKEAKAQRKAAKKHWETIIADLPLEEIGDRSETIAALALQWTLGKATMCAAPTGSSDAAVGQTSIDLTEQQRTYAQLIINEVADEGLGEHAAVIALATAMQESTLQMYWNSSVSGSKELSNGGPEGGFDLGGGRKSLSVGLFQQQVFADGTWGTVNDAMDPAKSTAMFLKVLTTDKRLKGWEQLPITVAAQLVQRSAFPSHYAKWETQARTIVRDMPPTGKGGYESDHTKEAVEAGGGIQLASNVIDLSPRLLQIQLAADAPGKGVEANGGDSSHLKIDPNVQPDTKAVMKSMMDLYPSYIYSMGGMRAGSVGHGSGRATDLMIKDYKSDAGILAGNTIAQFLIDNRTALGVDYLIWKDKIWTGPEKGWREYSKGGFGKHLAARGWNDTTLHHDHIHVETLGSAGTGGELKANGTVVEGVLASADNGTAAGCGSQSGGAASAAVGVSTGVGDDYPFRNPVGVSSRPQDGCTAASCIDPWRTYKRECVSFVAWRMNVQMGWKEGEPAPFTPSALGLARFGNAAFWKDNLGQAGFKTDDVPAVGAIAWFASNGGYHTQSMGHVAVVSEVHDDGTVSIEQYNRKAFSYSTDRISVKEVDGFIHVADIDTTKAAAQKLPAAA